MITKSMLKSAYVDMLTDYGLCALNVMVGAGGALVVQGLKRTTADIDVSVGKTVFLWIKEHRDPVISMFAHGDGSVVEVLNDPNHPAIDFHLESEWEEGMMVEDVYCYTIETNLCLKKRLNREKDQADIALIEELLRSPSKRRQISHPPRKVSQISRSPSKRRQISRTSRKGSPKIPSCVVSALMGMILEVF